MYSQLNQTKLEFPAHCTVHELFYEQAERYADRLAVADETLSLTFQELNERSNQVAHYLKACGVSTHDFVAVMMGRSAETVVAILGVLKAGAAYVPIDPTYPEDRISYMVEDSEARVVLVQRSLPEHLLALSDKIVCIENIPVETPAHNLEIVNGADDLAAMIYTSGSTGRPKGTMFIHRGVVNTIAWLAQEDGYSSSDTVISLISFSFDASMMDIFGSIGNGANLYILSERERYLPDQIAAAIERVGGTVLVITTSLFVQFVANLTEEEIERVSKTLRFVHTGGEAVLPEAVRSFQRRFGTSIPLMNGYGPTETSVSSTYYIIDHAFPEDWTTVPIGRPHANYQCYVLDEQMNLCPVGVEGELYIGGVGVTRGYWKQEEKTREVFLPDPFSTEPDAKFYKTGDLCRLMPNGLLEYIGRIDDQVKVRGYRIETGEIAEVLLQHPDIQMAAVVPRRAADGNNVLYGFYTSVRDDLEQQQLKSFLDQTLPEFMVPTRIIRLDVMPLTPNGKIDRKALMGLAEEDEFQAVQEYVEPVTPTEVKLAAIWEAVFKRTPIGLEDHFFDLGGHSLLSMQVANRIQKEWGIKIEVKDLFAAPTVRELALLVDHSAGGDQHHQQVIQIPKATEQEFYELSNGQKRLWFLQQFNPANRAYELPFHAVLDGELNVSAFQTAIELLVQRHPSLRTYFVEVEGQPYQAIREESNVEIVYEDMAMLEEAEQKRQILEQIGHSESVPFDLSAGPLMRVMLFGMGATRTYLYLNLHHIISDGWSHDLLMEEIAQCYEALVRGEQPVLPALTLTYADYAQWQHAYVASGALDEQEAYWTETLAKPLPVLQLPTDQERPEVQTDHGDLYATVVSSHLLPQLRAVAKQEGVSLYMLLLSAYVMLMHELSDQDDIIVGTPIAGRMTEALESVYGFFANTLAIRTRFAGVTTLRDLLHAVKGQTLQAFEHQAYPFDLLIEKVNPDRDPSRTPIFSTVFALQQASRFQRNIGSLHMEYVLDREYTTAMFDLMLNVIEGDELQLWFEFNTDLFNRETVVRFAELYEQVLTALTTQLTAPLSTLKLLPEEEHSAYQQYNVRQAEFVAECSVAKVFGEQAIRHGQRIAISTADSSLTYRELDERSNQVAHWLRQQGLIPNQFVGILMDRGVEIVIAILGVLKAGGAYVPIDPNYPEDRVRYMVEDTQATALLTQRSVQSKVPDLGHRIVCIEDIPADLSTASVETVNGPEDVGAVIYTSGSTGKPKGTLMLQRSIVNFAEWLRVDFAYSEQDTVLSATTFSFDASVGDTFGTLLNGARMHILSETERYSPEGIASAIERVGGTRMFLTTSLFVQFATFLEQVDYAKIAKTMKTLSTGGEALLPEVVRAWQRRFGTKIELVNGYGPTECTIFSTIYRITEPLPETMMSTPIGVPLPNYDLYVLNSRLQPCPVNVPGELYIGGAGVSLGYLNQPDKTDEAFLPHPFDQGRFVYKTGDLVRLLPDGNLEYIGRKDHQVKVRGYRIETGEIESVMLQHQDVQLAAVIARRAADGNNSLYGFYVAEQAAEQEAELREFLASRLPEFMIPTRLIRLDAMPLSPNGKVDRNALNQLAEAEERESVAIYAEPSTPTEQLLAEIWATVLKREQISVYDNFFDLGGHSLLATQVINRVGKNMRVTVRLQDLFSYPTLKKLAQHIEAIAQDGQPSIGAEISWTGEQEHYPLSNAQKRLWFLYKLDPNSVAYKVPMHVMLRGTLHIAALESALQAIINRHDALRSCLIEVDGIPRQMIQPQSTVRLQHADLSHVAGLTQREMLRRAIQQEGGPFDLTEPPLRMILIKLSEGEFLLSVNMHHIITDGWSVDVFLSELTATYTAHLAGQQPELAPLLSRYVDFAKWQETELEKGSWEGAEAYWLEKLAKPLPVLELPYDYQRPDVQTSNGEWLTTDLPSELIEPLRTLAAEQQVSLHVLLLSAYKLLLHRLTGSDDLIVGTPVSGRSTGDLEAMIGFFVNTLAIRTRLDGVRTLHDLLNRVKEETYQAYQHESYPFDLVVEKLNPDRDPSRTPIFSVMFAFQNEPQRERQMADVVLQPLEYDELDEGIAKFDLTLTVSDQAGKLRACYEYNTDLFKPETIQRMADLFVIVLEAFVGQLHEPINSLELLTAADLAVYAELNSRRVEVPMDRTIADLFHEQAKRHADRIALSTNEGELTYGELNERSNQVAHWLRQQGVTRDQFVGIMMERSIDIVVAILGVLKAGGAYVPIDPEYPEDRIGYMIEDSDTRIVLTHRKLADSVPALGQRAVDLETISDGMPTHDLAVINESDDLAYVIYTSGSTGRPKGTQMRHRGAVNFANWLRVDHGYGEGDVVMSATTFSFDASVGDLFGAVLNGGRLHILSNQERVSSDGFAAATERIGGTRVFLTTALFQQFVTFLTDEEYLKLASSLRTIFFGGEYLAPEVVRTWQRRFDNRVQLVHVYGPTETTVYATHYPITEPIRSGQTNIPIGKALINYELYVCNDMMQLCPLNVVGELYIGGVALSEGYLNQPDKTAEVFVPHPFAKEEGAMLYKTGDLVRLLPSGDIEYVSRRDDQVKVRGFRIELGEVAEAMLQHPAVQTAAVLARRATDGTNQLYGFFTAEQEIEGSELKRFLGQQVPSFMIPTYLQQLAEMPLSPNGKIDRRELAKIAEEDSFAGVSEYVAPTTETERVLADIWATVLGKEQVGVQDNFFDLGGHSLLATQVFNRMQQSLQVKIELKDIFTYPTVGELATFVDSLLSSGQSSQVIHLPQSAPRGSYEDEHYPLSHAQKRMWFLYHFDPTSKFYNVPTHTQIKGQLDQNAFAEAFRALVERHLSLRTVFAEIDGTPRQRITSGEEIELQVVDLTEHMAHDQRQVIRDTVRASEEMPFVLTTGPLVRAILFVLDANESHLYLNLHHIITDGWSQDVIMRDLADAYRSFVSGTELNLPTLEHHYVDYAAWQEQELENGGWDEQEAFWLNTLAKPLPVLNLPLDYQRPEVQTFNGAIHFGDLPQDLMEKLNGVAKQQGVSMYMLLFTSYLMVLHYITKDEDIIVGTPVAGRTIQSLEPIVGFFVNTLAIRVRFDGVQTLQDLLMVVKQQILNSFANQAYPFDLMIEKVNPERDTSRSPVFSTMFIHNKMARDQLTAGDLELKPHLGDGEHTISKFDLALIMVEGEQEWQFGLEYNTDLFHADTIQRITDSLLSVLGSFTGDVTTPIGSMQLLSKEDQLLYQQLNATQTEFPAHSTIDEQFYEQAARNADSLAVSDATTSMTYQELNQRSNQLAHRLVESGVGQGQFVGIMLERSVHSIVAMLAVLKAGAAYLPIDPEYPQDRIQYMVEDSGTNVLITNSVCQERVQGHNLTTILMEEVSVDLPTDDLPIEHTGDDLAYVIYTSGSTGRPKGVLLRHVGVLNLARGTRKYGFTEGDTVLQFISHSFDASVGEIFPALLGGAHLHILSQEQRESVDAFADVVASVEATTATIVPVFLNQLVTNLSDQDLSKLATLKRIIVGGEALPANVVRAWYQRRPAAIPILNEYGPTEATVTSLIHEIKGVSEGQTNMPIGKPLANYEVYVLNRWMQICPVNVIGEIYIGSVGLAAGYHNLPDKTAEVFVPHPFSAKPGAQLYKTGDLGRLLPDGLIEYAGRIDAQIKVRGHRIEIGEIEEVILGHSDVELAVVMPYEVTSGNTQLVAFYTSSRGVEAIELQHHLATRLPAYMMPTRLQRLDDMPLSPNGKIDRKQLPAPDLLQEQTDTYEAPRNELEQRVAAVWATCIGYQPVGIHDNFFAIGGDSIASMSVVSGLKRAGFKVLVSDLFKHQTVAQLVEHIQTNQLFADPAEVDEAGRDQAVTGIQPLSHVQLRTFALPIDHQRFVLPVVLDVAKELHPHLVQEAVQTLVNHHDMLRVTFEVSEGGIQQIIRTPDSVKVDLVQVDLTGLSGEDQRIEYERVARELIDLLSFAEGVLMRTALFQLGESNFRVLWLIHHLLDDAVSLSILQRDLIEVYEQLEQGKEPSLPARSTSYAEWTRSCIEFIHSQDGEAVFDYWMPLLEGVQGGGTIPVDQPTGTNRVCDGSAAVLTIDQDTTQLLRGSVSESCGLALHDILLTATMRALGRWTGESRVGVMIHGHGRNPLREDDTFDLSRTVGFFATSYPVYAEVTSSQSVQGTAEQVRLALEHMPQEGTSFDLLRYLSTDASVQEFFERYQTPEVLFNFYGTQATGSSSDSDWNVVNEFSMEFPQDQELPYNLTIFGQIENGCISLHIGYSNQRYRSETIERLVSDLEAEIQAFGNQYRASGVLKI